MAHITKVQDSIDKHSCQLCKKEPYRWKIRDMTAIWLVEHQYVLPRLYKYLSKDIELTYSGRLKLKERRPVLVCDNCKELIVNVSDCSWDNGKYRKKEEIS